MQVSAKADYALRALVVLAAGGGGPIKGEALARAQDIPPRFLESILAQLRQRGILLSRRGAEGGYWLARPAELITLAEVIRATDGPLASVRGQRPESVAYQGAAERLSEVWIAVRSSLRAVLEAVTLADVAAGELPPAVRALLDEPGARSSPLAGPTLTLARIPHWRSVAQELSRVAQELSRVAQELSRVAQELSRSDR